MPIDSIVQPVDPEKQIFDLKQLLEISRSLNSTLDYSILIDSILYTCMAQLKVTKACLFTKKTLDSSSFSLHRNYKGFDLERRCEYQIHEDHAMIGLLENEFSCYTPGELSARLGGEEGLECLFTLVPSLIIPLKAKGQVSGIIVLGERIDDSPFTAYEREYALNIATMASIAINNSCLFEMTTTDMMTKLKMKHYFMTVLAERMERASELDTPLSVVMMDVDRFKRFNDTYGHTAGDVALKGVAGTILSHIRDDDVAARFGGEEFVVLLWNTDAREAVGVAERIRVAVEGLQLECSAASCLGVTISCGVAPYLPGHDRSAESLVDRADRAMYRSKQAGRNRVSIVEGPLGAGEVPRGPLRWGTASACNDEAD